MNQDKKDVGTPKDGKIKADAPEAQTGMRSMAADKPSGGTSVGSSMSFGSGGAGPSGGTARDTGASAVGASTHGMAGDKPPTAGPASGMSGAGTEDRAYAGSRYRGDHNGHHQDMGEEARRVAEDARGMAGQFLGDVRSAAEEMLEERKARAAEAVHGVAEALRRTAGNLRDENETVARYAEQAAETVDRFSGAVRERHLGDMIADLDDFARRQPTVFLIGAVAAGFLVGRFMAASSERRREREWHQDRLERRGQRGETERLAGYGSLSRPRGNA